MQLRTGKITAAPATTATALPKFDAMAELKKVNIHKTGLPVTIPVSTIDTSKYMKMHMKHHENTPKTTISVIQGLVNSVQYGHKLERMQKISLIYDIILADKTFREYSSNAKLIEVIRKEASKHMESIKDNEILSLLDTAELVAAQKHFGSILEKFIDGSFGTPSDYDQYSYHYDIMKKIGYEAAAQKKAEIFNYAHEVDYDKFLICEYILNEVTVYELYAMVTYNTYEALPNYVSYDYCFETALSWYIRDNRD